MSHQRGDDGQIDATIHQVRGKTVPQGAWGNVVSQSRTRCSGRDNLANIVAPQASLMNAGAKQRPAFSVLQQISQQLGVQRLGDGNGSRAIPFGPEDQQFLAFAVHMCDIERTQFARAQPATIQQQYDQAIASGGGPRSGGGFDQPLGFFQVE